MRRFLLFLLLAPIPALAAGAAPPSPSPSALCDAAIVGAERSLQLPPRLLGAIAEVESGRLSADGAVRPWPWTINAEGRGQFFETKAAAIAAVRDLQLRGVKSIDVGCMQVNLMYHPTAFASLDDAFEPSSNAAYAGRFLNTLYGISGSWLQAAAAYHSETPAIGAEYQRRVVARWQMPGAPRVAGPQPAYADFATAGSAYGAFRPSDRVYAAFAEPSAPAPTRVAHK